MTDSSFYKQTTLPDLFPEEARPPPIPQKIGPYKIESLLNKGGMSLLYLGLHPETHQPLAIKVLSPKYVTHQETVGRFLKEAHIIALTNHPNIVKLYGQGEWEGGLYIAMELIRGISLRQFIMQQSLSLKRSLDIILQVAYALLHLHTHGVIHRDLKPENILITEDGEIKVIDFGIAGLHEESEQKKSSGFMGTPHYMSPEQKENPAGASYSSDIYALGIITYELVLGKLSYGLINLGLLPKGLRKIVGKALAVSSKERYQDIVDFISDISQYLKSKELEKDRTGSDQIKELFEILQKASSTLSPFVLPDWPQLEIGLAKFKGIGPIGLYYDFFKLPNNSYSILLAEPLDPGFDSSIYIAVLRGMIRSFIHATPPSSQEPFHLLPFISTLNRMLAEDTLKQQFSLSFLVLDPLRDLLTFVCCGGASLLHLPAGVHTPRKLASQNPPLGSDPLGEFSETSDNWNIGDTLILHTFQTTDTPSLEQPLIEAFSENAVLSAQSQAEAILKKMATEPKFSLAKSQAQAILSLQRIG